MDCVSRNYTYKSACALHAENGLGTHMGENTARRLGVRKLVERARRGDEKAFEELIGSHRKKILYLALHYSDNADDAEDCAQEAILKAYRGIGKLKDPDAFESWLHSIVKFTCYRKKGSMGRERVFVGRDSDANDAVMSLAEERTEFLPAEYAEDSEKRAIVLSLIKELNENYQEALLLFYFEDLTYKEIATALGVSTTKVTNDLKRARQALRKKIEERSGTALATAAVPLGAAPTLSRVYELDCAQTVTAGMEERFMEYVGTLATVSAASGAGAIAIGHGLGAKIAAGGVAALLVTGVAIGAVAANGNEQMVNQAPPAAPAETIQAPQPPEPEVEPIEEPVAPEESVSIETLADMIGSEEEARLLELEAGLVPMDDVVAFMQLIDAPQKGYAELQDGTAYSVCELVRGGKQLFVAVKATTGSTYVEVAHLFGDEGPIPDMFDFVELFDR